MGIGLLEFIIASRVRKRYVVVRPRSFAQGLIDTLCGHYHLPV